MQLNKNLVILIEKKLYFISYNCLYIYDLHDLKFINKFVINIESTITNMIIIDNLIYLSTNNGLILSLDE